MSAAISIQNLSVKFRGCDAINELSLDIPTGSLFALLGENGAGKTTLIRVLTGFLKPTSGSCRVLGMDPISNTQELRRQIGYVSDAPTMYDWMTVAEIGWFASSFYESPYLDHYREAIERYGVPESRKIKQLSKGQRAKVALSLALAHDPGLLILDEPTSGLDPHVRREFLESMLDRAATGRTVLLSSHQISEVERVADHVAILHQGALQVTAPLDELSESMTEVTVNLDDSSVSLPELPQPVQVLSETREGRQVQMLVRHFNESISEFLESCTGVRQVQYRAASLEQTFIAFTRRNAKVRNLDKTPATARVD